MKILIIRLGAIGDVVLLSPTILNLKLSFPDSEIYLLTRSHIMPIAEKIYGIDEILNFPAKASFKDLFMMGEYLDKQNFDIILDMHGNLRSNYLSKHINAAIKAKYPKRRFERFAAVKFNRIKENPPHTIDLYNSVLEQCGAEVFLDRPIMTTDPVKDNKPIFDDAEFTVAIAPGASYATKQWPPDRFEKLAVDLHKSINAGIVLLLTEADGRMNALRKDIPEEYLKIYMNEPLSEVPNIIARSDLLISNDSGLAHIGSAVGTPVVALFGPTHPTLGFSPRGLRDQIIQTDEYCRPCSLHGRKKCYRDRQYCFENISVDSVLATVTEKLTLNHKGDKALFIDRDGTLIHDKDYLFDPELVEPIDGSFDAIKIARKSGYKIILISNQSGVARGYFGTEEVTLVNDKILQIFEDNDAPIDAVYYCPHHKKGIVPEFSMRCNCRKPGTGMIEKAVLEHNIDAHHSFVIGDKESDIRTAYASGGRGILVRTGYGAKSEENIDKCRSFKPEYIADNFLTAVEYIIRL